MKKKVLKIIRRRATIGQVGPKANVRRVRGSSVVFSRNPEKYLRELYESAPAKERPALVTKWLREIQAANMIGGIL